jgi:predicted secreted protein
MNASHQSPAMRRLAILAFALAATACTTAPVAPSAPATSAAPAASEKSDLDNAPDGTSITMKRGGELMVKLDTNLTTGYQWTMGPAATGPVLSPIGSPIYVNKGNEPRFVGAGGINVFRFKAEQAGQVTMQFDHKRSWETNVAPAKSVRYTVIVAP